MVLDLELVIESEGRGSEITEYVVAKDRLDTLEFRLDQLFYGVSKTDAFIYLAIALKNRSALLKIQRMELRGNEEHFIITYSY